MFVATVILLKWPATVKRESSTNAGRLREDCLTEVQFINKLRAKQIERNKERLEKLGKLISTPVNQFTFILMFRVIWLFLQVSTTSLH